MIEVEKSFMKILKFLKCTDIITRAGTPPHTGLQ